MPKFFAPADKATDWQRLLAKPDLHWKTGRSAKSIAYSWTEAEGFVGLYGQTADPNRLYEAKQLGDITLYLGWVVGNAEYLTR